MSTDFPTSRAEGKPDVEEAARIRQLDQTIAKIDKELDQLRTRTQLVENAISELQEKILEVGGIQLRSQKSKVDGIVQMIELNNERLTKAQVSKAKAEKDIAKSEKAMADLVDNLAAVDAELAELSGKARGSSSDLEAAQAKVEDAKAVMEERKEEKDVLREEIDNHSEAMNAFRAVGACFAASRELSC